MFFSHNKELIREGKGYDFIDISINPNIEMHIIVRQTSLHTYAAIIVFSYFHPSFLLAKSPNGILTQFAQQINWPGIIAFPLLHKSGNHLPGTKSSLTIRKFKRFCSTPKNVGSIKTNKSNLFFRVWSLPENKNKCYSINLFFAHPVCHLLKRHTFINLSLS